MNGFSMADRTQLLKQYGNFCGAYSTLRKGMKYFDDEKNEGYIAYAPTLKRAFAFGDPVVDESKKASILRHFDVYCRDKKLKPIFIQSDYATVKYLHDELGYCANEFATEIKIDLNDFNLKGKKKTHLRRWKNTAVNAGVSVSEVSFSDLDPNELKDLCDEFLKHKGNKERLFLLLPSMHFEDKEDLRVFCGFMDGRLVAIVTFEPIYSNGEVVGYSQVHMRRRMSIPNGTIDYITLYAMDTFKEEGRNDFSLGVCTYISENYDEIDTNGIHSNFIKFMFYIAWTTWFGNMFYPVKGNHFHKEKYRGDIRKVYAAMPKASIMDVVGFLHVNSFI